jgi:transmembrane sensor
MTDLSPELRSALSHADTAWDEERAEQTWQGLRVKRTRRTAVRAGAATVVILLAAGGLWMWQQRGGDGGATNVAERPEVAPAPDDVRAPEPEVESLALRLDDGSVVTPEAEAEVDLVADTRERVEVRVVSGKSHFDVKRVPEREFEVDAGNVKIAVYSSQFSVARYDGRTEVWAKDGYLKIEWDGKVQEVRAGESAEFPPPDAIDVPADAIDPATPVARARSPRQQVEDLMRAADTARAGRHPSAALKPLDRVVREFPRDSRAPLAAFTRGRVLLDDLDQPARAAKAFRKARDLAPNGPLAEDALAREAEAWARAGKTDRARDRAQKYLDKYPEGHRVPAVRQLLE